MSQRARRLSVSSTGGLQLHPRGGGWSPVAWSRWPPAAAAGCKRGAQRNLHRAPLSEATLRSGCRSSAAQLTRLPTCAPKELDFPCSAGRVKLSSDGQFLVVTGIHPPMVRTATRGFSGFLLVLRGSLARAFPRQNRSRSTSCRSLRSNSSATCSPRCAGTLASAACCPACLTPTMASQIVDFQVLSEDYSKLVFACADRSLVFHAKFGGYVSSRLPKMPRSVTYHAPSADVLASGSSSEIYRCAHRRLGNVHQQKAASCCTVCLTCCASLRSLSLEAGRFLTPLPSGSPGVNVARVCPVHGLLAAGGDDGALECFDLRAPLATTRLENASGVNGGGITCLRFESSGMSVRGR